MAKTINEWTSRDHVAECPAAKPVEKGKPFPQCVNKPGCCPGDILVNASQRSIILSGSAKIPTTDPLRIDPGDRRQGQCYIELTTCAIVLGLQRVRDLPMERLRELEKTRQIRTGERPQDWILEARRRSERGESPPTLEDGKSALTSLQRASSGLSAD